MPRCKKCKEKFEAKYFNQKYCLVHNECIQEHVIESKKKSKIEWQREKKVRKEKLMSRADWMNLLQKVFNTYIRKRDEGKPCISCGTDLTNKKVHASHYFSIGNYPNLRINEDNVHSSCDYCNLHLHGNHTEYSIRLPERIGKERFDELTNNRNKTALKLTIDEIKELIKHYRNEIKVNSN
jgi:hypothetical protein